jgi:DNA-binding CsgD family transcriptional regulator
VGEPGIGKSRLLGAIGEARIAAVGGIRVATTVYDLNVGLSFEYLREIVSALHRRLRLEAGLVERVNLADGRNVIRYVRDAIATASTFGPICIAVDDVFRASPAEIEALAYLVDRLQDLPIEWHFASRTERAVASGFEQLARANLLRTHDVPPLSLAECSDLLRSIDPALDDAGSRQIYARSGGNPFFAKLLVQGSSPWHVATLRAAVTQRLNGLSSDAQRMALLIATGRGSTREQLAIVSGLSKDAAQKICDELEERALLDVGLSGEMRFHHDLIAETVISSASETSRSRAYEAWLHFATDVSERIRCLEGAGRWIEVVDQLLAEGWRCAEQGQLEAETLASRALSIVAASDPRRFEIDALRARLNVEIGRFEEARRDFQSFVSGRAKMDAAVFACLYGRFAVAAAPEFGTDGLPTLLDLLERAPAECPHAYAALAHARALTLYCEGEVSAARDSVRGAMDMPASALERLRQQIWDAYLSVQVDPAENGRASAVLAKAASEAESLGATAEAARAYFMCACIAHREDDLVAAEAWCLRGLAVREPKPRSVTVALRSQLCEYLLLRGRAWEALGILLEATEETEFLRRDARVTVGAVLALAQSLTGSLEAAALTLSTVDDSGVSPVIFHSVEAIRGFIFEMTSQTDAAAEAYDRVIASATVAETSLAYGYVGRARIALGNRDSETLERLFASAKIAQSHGPKSFRVAELISGFIALLEGDARAIPATISAIEAGRSGYDSVFTRLVVGEVAGDAECIRAAAAAFDASGSRTLADRARAAARRNGHRLASPRSPGRSLSERSRSVAIAIAAGRTNAEIASALHLSPRTVEKYVSSLLDHFSVRSRVEIAGIILRGELDVRV